MLDQHGQDEHQTERPSKDGNMVMDQYLIVLINSTCVVWSTFYFGGGAFNNNNNNKE